RCGCGGDRRRGRLVPGASHRHRGRRAVRGPGHPLPCKGCQRARGQAPRHIRRWGSALGRTVGVAARARSLTLVHRRAEFRAAPASVAKMRELAAAGRLRCFEALPHSLITTDGQLGGVSIKAPDGTVHALEADHLLVFFGLHPKLGPIAEWGLELEKKALKVDTEK